MVISKSNAAASQWDELIAHSPDGGLLQSSVWARFQEALGRRVEYTQLPVTRYPLRALVVEQKLPLGFSYVYSPRGPIFGEFLISNFSTFGGSPIGGQFLMTELMAEVRRRFPHAIFWRIEPPYEMSNFQFLISNFRVHRALHDVQPSMTLVIDLTKSEAELLAAMKEKTRYNIRLAERHGVTVRSSNDAADVERFLDLLEQTAKRDHFRAHPREYYRTMLGMQNAELRMQNSGGGFELFLAEHDGKLLAGAIVAFTNYELRVTSYELPRWCYYLHGASSSEHREFMAPYALHWAIMREAKRRGCTRYDLWGISATSAQSSLRAKTGTGLCLSKRSNPEHEGDCHGPPTAFGGPRNDTREDRLAGVTRFKTGFAPDTAPTTYCGTWDMVFRPLVYKLYRFWSRGC